MGIIRVIKKFCGFYEPDYEYWVYLKDIKVDPKWRHTRIGYEKWRAKKRYYNLTGELQSKIILDQDFNLIDGYSSVRIAEVMELDKVPVYFVGGKK